MLLWVENVKWKPADSNFVQKWWRNAYNSVQRMHYTIFFCNLLLNFFAVESVFSPNPQSGPTSESRITDAWQHEVILLGGL